jgi:hypothetical protein
MGYLGVFYHEKPDPSVRLSVSASLEAESLFPTGVNQHCPSIYNEEWEGALYH